MTSLAVRVPLVARCHGRIAHVAPAVLARDEARVLVTHLERHLVAVLARVWKEAVDAWSPKKEENRAATMDTPVSSARLSGVDELKRERLDQVEMEIGKRLWPADSVLADLQ